MHAHPPSLPPPLPLPAVAQANQKEGDYALPGNNRSFVQCSVQGPFVQASPPTRCRLLGACHCNPQLPARALMPQPANQKHRALICLP